MARFNLNKEKVGGGAPSTKLPPGEYDVRIEKNFVKESENKKFRGGPYYVSEFTVTKVYSGGKAFTDRHNNFYPETKEGDYRSWSNDMAHAQGPGTLNEFLLSVDGVDARDPEAVKAVDRDALCDDSLDPKNPMRGAPVHIIVSLKATGPNKENDFLLHQFAVATE